MRNKLLVGILALSITVTTMPTSQSMAMGMKYNGNLNSVSLDDEMIQNSYEVSFKKIASWDGYINGEITIKNIGIMPIENWKLEFDFEGTIENIWNASVVSSEDGIIVSNLGWNQEIAINEEISFGFIAAVKTEASEPKNMKLKSNLNLSSNETKDIEEISSVIQEYIDDIGTDWDGFLDLHEKARADSLKEFLSDSENHKEHNGMLNVISAELDGWYEVSYNEAASQLPEEMLSESSRYFVVQGDYEVYEDTNCYHSGGQCHLMSLTKENNQWKVGTFSGYDAEYKENYIEDSDYTSMVYSVKAANVAKAKTKHSIPSDNTKIVLGQKVNGKFQKLANKNQPNGFLDYCLGVTAGECRGVEYDGAARKAIIMAIKTYTWHYICQPIDPNTGINLLTTMQSYVPSKVNENPKVKSQYNEVKNIWMESYKGYVAEAKYVEGKYNGDAQNGGVLKQSGCRFLADKKGKNFYQCLHYYYDNSTFSNGGAIRFFDQNKNVINK